MKRWLGLALAAALGATMLGAPKITNAAAEADCKAAYLCDYASGEAVYAKNETKRLPIASMCKIMTLLLTFEAAERGEISLGETVTASERAAGMGGSQVFLGAGLAYRAEELIKSVAVCSANDSCVALAERIAGSEENFVARMNARAKELGAENTLFANCTGLPKEPQYSCAKDVAVMLRALLGHKKYYEFAGIRLEDFRHPDGRTTSMTNTNKLLRAYKGCDGGKTGFTSEAGFCLAATAKRDKTRLISVVIGAESSKGRFADVSALFDEGFANYETKLFLGAGQPVEAKAQVRGGKVKEISVCAKEELAAFTKRGESGGFHVEYEINELRAPVEKGTAVGQAILYKEGVEVGKIELVAAEEALRFGWWDAYRELAENWN